MENDNDEKFEELTTTDVRNLQLSMRYFFIIFARRPQNIIWELYKAWVYNSADIVEGEEIKICNYL